MSNKNRKEIAICVIIAITIVIGIIMIGVALSKIDYKEFYLRQFSLEIQLRKRGCNMYKVPGIHYREILKNCTSLKTTNSTQT